LSRDRCLPICLQPCNLSLLDGNFTLFGTRFYLRQFKPSPPVPLAELVHNSLASDRGYPKLQ
jgi:hypothetical protein